ncbi:hypothetical protein CVV68_15475 [Arthrobacter livingstonensis]|uniref:Septum formation-related domain-containing protein n=1 Tax=Arthrobacter livingstonensis TaxID=670078 RepID=A0A2V5LHL3_9MICC|nr:hypothetical protein [Arthrobacter livingstonensis]PYI66190.1 hypothetical protein CVV68_15475 [Arthrobacter livingstonensis]
MNDHDNANGHDPQAAPPADSVPDAEAVPDAAQEPRLSGTEYEFAEPQLGAAEISSEVAETVDLDKVQAETAAVEREAERSTQLAASEVISSVPPANVDFKAPAAETGWDVDESTVLRTDFTKPPVANNPWTNKAGPADSPETDGALGAPAESTAAPAGEAQPTAAPAGEPPAVAKDAATDSPQSSRTASTAPQAAPAQPAFPPRSVQPSTPDAHEPDGQVPDMHDPDMHDAGRPPAAPPAGPEAEAGAEQGGAKELAEGERVQGGAPEGGPARRPYVGRGIDDGSGWHRPETPWQQSATPWQPRANAWQSPGQVAQGVADAAAAAGLAASEAAKGSAATETPNEPQGASAQPERPDQPGYQPPYGSPAAPGNQPGVQPPHGSNPSHGTSSQPGTAVHGGNPSQNAGPSGAPAIPPVPGYPGQGGPGQPGGTQGSGTPGSPGNKNKLFIILGVVVIGLFLVGLLIWMVLNLFAGSTKADSSGHQPVTATAGSSSSGQPSAAQRASSELDVILAKATPEEWFDGDCLRGYTTFSQPADVVVCNSPHSAQVVNSHIYADSDTFPGDNALADMGTKACKTAPVTDAAKAYKGLKEFQTYPSENSWNMVNDRTVHCIAVDPSGENLTTSLIK